MKKWMVLCLILALMIQMASLIVYAGDYPEKLYLMYNENVYKYTGRLVTVAINDSVIETGDMPAVIIDGRTLVPVREVFESKAFGAVVDWNGDLRQVSISYEDKLIILTLDDKIAYVNGVAVELDVPPMLIQDVSKDYAKTMIPLRFVSESLSFDVSWDHGSYTAMLDNGAVIDMPQPEKVTDSEGVVPGTSEEDVDPETQEEDNSLSKPDDEVRNVSQSSDRDEDEAAVIVAGEKLDGLTDAGANRELPTPLLDNPVHWEASDEQMEELAGTYVETTITNEKHDETEIRRVTYEDSGAYKQFVIKASSAISEVDYFVWDNKFIMDISDAVNKLEAEVPYEDNPILTGIRASQYSASPNATRVVFDLIDAGNKFDLSFNEERTELYVRVTDNSIHDIYLGQNANGDYIQVTGVAAPDVKMFRLSAPDRIVIDFPNTQTLLGFNESDAEGQYIRKIRTAQFDETTTRIVVETDGQADYHITKANGGETVIQFTEPSYRNIAYENIDNPTISLEQDEVDIRVDDIIYSNDYMDRRFSIILSESYGDLFGDGSLKVNDGIIETVEVSETEDGRTLIIIESTTVHEYRIEETDDKIYIKAYRPSELFDRVAVVDVGHGGKDPGAVANGLYEKDLNLKITKYLKEMLDEDGSVQVYYTRLSDWYPTLQERCDLANEVEADMFLSIHNNAYNPSEEGTETLYFPSEVKGKLTSPALAEIFQDHLVDTLDSHDRGIKQRENLYVLKHTVMPAVIVEIGFLTNSDDAAKLKQDEYLERAAEALFDATLEVFEAYPTRR